MVSGQPVVWFIAPAAIAFAVQSPSGESCQHASADAQARTARVRRAASAGDEERESTWYDSFWMSWVRE